jgi:hypothetical protein
VGSVYKGTVPWSMVYHKDVWILLDGVYDGYTNAGAL